MSTTPVIGSLHGYESKSAWSALAKAIGIELPDACLPTTCWCPQCNTLSLLITECTTNTVAVECRACDFAGDVVDLAAGSWKCSREDALQRLSPHLQPVRKPTSKTPSTIEELWHKAQSHHVDEPIPKEVIATVYALAYGKPNFDEYAETYGWIDSPTVYSLLHRPLRIPKCKYYVVVPSWLTTTRLAGVYLVTKHKDSIVRDYIPCDKESPDSGLTGLEAALKTGESTIYATYEPLIAPRISKIQYRYTQSTSPFVGWHWDDQCRTTLAWQSLSGKKIVFWGPTLSWSMLCMAAMTDGHICLKGPPDAGYDAVSAYVRRKEPAEWIAWLTTKTRTWQEAMNRWVPFKATHEDVMAMIGHMRANGFDPQLISGQLNHAARIKWEKCITNHEQLSKTQTIWLTNPKLRILRTRSGWYAQQAKEVWSVLNADLQFDAMFLRDGEAWYRGKVVCAAATYPFEGKAADIERECWLWLRNLAALHQVHLEFSTRYRSRLFEIATLFKRPATMAEKDLPAFDPSPIRKRHPVAPAAPVPIFDLADADQGTSPTAGQPDDSADAEN